MVRKKTYEKGLKGYLTYTSTPQINSTLLIERPERVFGVIVDEKKKQIKRDLYDMLIENGAEADVISEIKNRSQGKRFLCDLKVVISKNYNGGEVESILIRVPGGSMTELKENINRIKERLHTMATPKECVFDGEKIVWQDGKFVDKPISESGKKMLALNAAEEFNDEEETIEDKENTIYL
jgi:hypothetical protein